MFKVCPIIILLLFILTNAEFNFPKERQQKLITTKKLSDGHEMPFVGLGTWQMIFDRLTSRLIPFSSFFTDYNKVTQAVKNAIKIGYRHIDTAYYYNNEKAIGKALKEVIDSNQVEREDLFITTKIWNTFHRRPKVVENLKTSLKDLGLDYVDLALIHFPMGFKEGYRLFPLFFNLSIIPYSWEKNSFLETWKGLEDAHKSGLAKSIGVANFNIDQLKILLDSAEVRPVVNQVECNPYYNEYKLVEFCKRNNIVVVAYSPFRQSDEDLIDEPILQKIAYKLNKTVRQVILRWNIQRGIVVIPKTSNKLHMFENLDVFNFEISDEDMRKVSQLKQKEKIVSLKWAKNHPDYPYNIKD